MERDGAVSFPIYDDIDGKLAVIGLYRSHSNYKTSINVAWTQQYNERRRESMALDQRAFMPNVEIDIYINSEF